MATHYLSVLALVLCMVQQCDCVRASMSIAPSKLSLNASTTPLSGRVTVSCEAQALANGELVSLMTIERVLHSNPNAAPAPLVTALALIDGGSPSLENQGQGMSVSGNTNTGSLNLIMDQTNCKDGGMYTCKVATQSSGGQREDTASANLTVEVAPGLLTMIPDPSGMTTWKVNDVLKMTCNGPLGTVEGNMKVTWRWDYRKTTDSFINWQTYDGNDTDIEDRGTTKPNDCYLNGISTLTRRLTLDDTARVYRCYIFKDVPYSQFAAEQRVGTVTVDGLVPGSGGATGDGDASTKADVGAIVGGVIGALVVVVVIIVIIFFVLRRRRQQKGPETYDESASRRADEQAPPYTVSDPGVTYSQPNRFRKGDKNRGHTNRAMDDDNNVDKKAPYDMETTPYDSKPARYENEFNQGRRNPSYSHDDQPRSRRYSSDDGGSHVNTSQQSIGYGDPTMGTAI